jgi:hypothetical protein
MNNPVSLQTGLDICIARNYLSLFLKYSSEKEIEYEIRGSHDVNENVTVL